MSTSTSTADSGTSYRFLVRSAEEAVGAIRKQLGDEARVVSVRAVKAGGLAGLLGSSRLEVIASVPASSPGSVPPPATPVAMAAVEELAVADLAPQPTATRRSFTPASAYGTTDAASVAVAPAATSVVARTTGRADEVRCETAPKLEALLRRSGLSETVVARLQTTAGWPGAGTRPLHEGLSEVAGQIRRLAANVTVRPLPTRAAFIGLPGVGCTTALCKWLSAEVFTRGRHGTVVSAEFDRPKGAEDLAVFAELLGAEFARQVPAANGEAASFCYVDVPPLSLTRPEENARLRAFLDEAAIPGRVLVVSGLLDSTVLRQACTAGLELGCTHLVFTQLDQLPQWGKLWDFLIEAPLTPLMATLGPSLSGECETDVVGAVLRRTFPWN